MQFSTQVQTPSGQGTTLLIRPSMTTGLFTSTKLTTTINRRCRRTVRRHLCREGIRTDVAKGFQRDQQRDAIVLHPAHELDRSHIGPLWKEATRALIRSRPRRLVLDLREVPRIDGAGVALVRELEDRCRLNGIELAIEGAVPAVAEFLAFVRRRSPGTTREPPPRQPKTAVLSRRVAGWAEGARAFAELVGRFTESAAHLAAHPHEIRFHDALYQVQRVGAEGVWLIAGLSVLLGVIMAFQGLGGARRFGSSLLVADVVTLSTTREMAPLLTGVIVTGRSAAAIAAEIGTMKVDEELDALSAMGFDVMRFLLLPRTVGLFVSTPLLTLLSIGAGLVGGAVVAASVLGLAPLEYFSEVRKVISGAQIASALVKGATFGLLIGVVACFEGLQARKGAEEVGRRTTAAVVGSILLVVAADAFFSIVTEVYGW